MESLLKVYLKSNDNLDTLYCKNGKCNAEYFRYCKFLKQNPVDLQNSRILCIQIKKI